ncbi:MAG: hypothetical protein KGI25_08265 [Thaumarchaeota archaeon]|nr:hypothetical protein [Nitrososphaerota archaeon]
MLGLVVDAVIGVVVVAAGIVAFRLWKAGKAVTGAAVVAGTETLVKDTAAEITPAIQAAIEKAVADAVAKAIAPKP